MLVELVVDDELDVTLCSVLVELDELELLVDELVLTLVELVLNCKVELEELVETDVELVLCIKNVDWLVELDVKLCSVDSELIDVELDVSPATVLELDELDDDEVSDCSVLDELEETDVDELVDCELDDVSDTAVDELDSDCELDVELDEVELDSL